VLLFTVEEDKEAEEERCERCPHTSSPTSGRMERQRPAVACKPPAQHYTARKDMWSLTSGGLVISF
jgi:hypothetical protein